MSSDEPLRWSSRGALLEDSKVSHFVSDERIDLDYSLLLFLVKKMLVDRVPVAMRRTTRYNGVDVKIGAIVDIPIEVLQEWNAWRGSALQPDIAKLEEAMQLSESMMLGFVDLFRSEISARERSK